MTPLNNPSSRNTASFIFTPTAHPCPELSESWTNIMTLTTWTSMVLSRLGDEANGTIVIDADDYLRTLPSPLLRLCI
jgi:hypothetical protein